MFHALSGLPPDSAVSNNATMKKLIKQEKLLLKRLNQIGAERKQFHEERDSIQSLTDLSDLIHLNVRGQRISTRRRTLAKIPDSKLASYFDDSSKDRLRADYDGSYFLDYNPALFAHLLDQLRVLRPNEPPVLRPPASPALAKSFNEMLNALKLPVAPRQGADLVVLNVGGEIITTYRETFTRQNISLPTRRDELGRVFLDQDPELFRSFLADLEQGKTFEELRGKQLYRSILADLIVARK